MCKLEYEKGFYSHDSIKKAAYRLSSFFTFDISISGKNKIIVTLTKNKTTSQEQFKISIENFKKYLNDESLREKLKKETEPVRNLILGIAFSKTNLKKDE
jgi:His-Xaa-Ser system protein HxsD